MEHRACTVFVSIEHRWQYSGCMFQSYENEVHYMVYEAHLKLDVFHFGISTQQSPLTFSYPTICKMYPAILDYCHRILAYKVCVQLMCALVIHFRAFEAFVIIMATTLLAFFCCMFLSTCVPDQPVTGDTVSAN